MANQTGRPIAPARKLVAAVMGTIAVFVVALGLGMSSWGVVVFGLAVRFRRVEPRRLLSHP